jgi:hypothetical protein
MAVATAVAITVVVVIMVVAIMVVAIMVVVIMVVVIMVVAVIITVEAVIITAEAMGMDTMVVGTTAIGTLEMAATGTVAGTLMALAPAGVSHPLVGFGFAVTEQWSRRGWRGQPLSVSRRAVGRAGGRKPRPSQNPTA